MHLCIKRGDEAAVDPLSRTFVFMSDVGVETVPEVQSPMRDESVAEQTRTPQGHCLLAPVYTSLSCQNLFLARRLPGPFSH